MSSSRNPSAYYPTPPPTTPHIPPSPISVLLCSPCYTELLVLHARFTVEKQALLDRLHTSVKDFRAASSSHQTLLAQAAQEKLDAEVAEIVEYQEQFQRDWVRMVERWAEDIGGKVGRHVKGVVSEMVRKNDAEGVVNLDGILIAVQVRCSEGN